MKYYIAGKISENIAETPEGYLICIGVPIARTGEMEYGPNETPLEGDKDGHVLISRDEEEVFRPETIASFEGKALTIAHPDEFVSPDNWKDLAKGVLQNVRRGKGEQKDDLIADLLVTDAMAIGLVKNGLREVSCGYEADYVQTKKGKGKQTNIIGNHLALVDQGRAGPQYAINDHKGDKKMNLKDRIKAIFAKAQDEAMKIADEAGEKEEKKDDKSKDEKMAGYDELVKMVDAIGAKIEKLMGAKDQAEGEVEKESPAGDEEEKEDKDKAKDDDTDMMARLKACEAALEKLLSKAGDEEEEESEDEEKSEDEEESEDDDMEDDDFEESTMVGDSATDVLSRAEILAPGIKKSKDIKVKALKVAYGTTDGKKVIDSLTGGKAPAYDSKETVNTLFIAASEVLKSHRSEELSKTKRPTTDDFNSYRGEGAMTAEKMNEINAKFYKRA